jgi:hypothetical protein
MPLYTKTDHPKNPLRFDTVKNVRLSLLRILEAIKHDADCFKQLYLCPDGYTYLACDLTETAQSKSYRNFALASILNGILCNFRDNLKSKLEEKQVDLYASDIALKRVIEQVKQIDYICPISFEEPIIPVQCVISGNVVDGLVPEQTYSLESIINFLNVINNNKESDKRYGLYIFNRAISEIFYLKYQLSSYPFSDVVHETIQKISKVKNLIIQSKYLVPVSDIFPDIEKAKKIFMELKLLRSGLDFSLADFPMCTELFLNVEGSIEDHIERLLLERPNQKMLTEIEEGLSAWSSLQSKNIRDAQSCFTNFFQPYVCYIRDSFIVSAQAMRPFNFIRSVR